MTVTQLDPGPKIIRISKSQAIECEFPHIVELAVPDDGLDLQLNRAISLFHSVRDIRPRFGRNRRENRQRYSRWCFSDSATADAFREQFGGGRLTTDRRPSEVEMSLTGRDRSQ
jgi:hypothetical protein